MNLAITRQLRRVKRLHADRAEEKMRRVQAALDAAVAEAAKSHEALEAWRADMPNKTAAIYATVLSQVVTPAALDEVKQRAIALREHEQVLQNRLQERQQSVRTAQSALQAASAALQAARRNLQKFDDMIETLQKLAALETERQEDSTLEEAAEQGHGTSSMDRGGMDKSESDWALYKTDDEHEWNQAVA